MAGMQLVLMNKEHIATEKVNGLTGTEGQYLPEIGDMTEVRGKTYRVENRHVPLTGFGQIITLYLVELSG
jgi:hypothetical protein